MAHLYPILRRRRAELIGSFLQARINDARKLPFPQSRIYAFDCNRRTNFFFRSVVYSLYAEYKYRGSVVERNNENRLIATRRSFVSSRNKEIWKRNGRGWRSGWKVARNRDEKVKGKRRQGEKSAHPGPFEKLKQRFQSRAFAGLGSVSVRWLAHAVEFTSCDYFATRSRIPLLSPSRRSSCCTCYSCTVLRDGYWNRLNKGGRISGRYGTFGRWRIRGNCFFVSVFTWYFYAPLFVRIGILTVV